MKLTKKLLIEEAKTFVEMESKITHPKIVGVTDGKAVGTYIECRFKEYLNENYNITLGSSSKGIDLPEPHINTDIKVSSIRRPQSSSPFKNIEQKIYGLGYNLLMFTYEKIDIEGKCYLKFKHCIFIESKHTGDYKLTKKLQQMIKNNAKEEEIFRYLKDNNIPGDEKNLKELAKKILSNPPQQGYLTIFNALQWRLRYNNILNLDFKVDGIYKYTKIN